MRKLTLTPVRSRGSSDTLEGALFRIALSPEGATKLTRSHYRLPLQAPLNGSNGTQAGSLCYAMLLCAVASSLRWTAIASGMDSGRSLDSLEGQ
jgi:hypothetical protein